MLQQLTFMWCLLLGTLEVPEYVISNPSHNSVVVQFPDDAEKDEIDLGFVSRVLFEQRVGKHILLTAERPGSTGNAIFWVDLEEAAIEKEINTFRVAANAQAQIVAFQEFHPRFELHDAPERINIARVSNGELDTKVVFESKTLQSAGYPHRQYDLRSPLALNSAGELAFIVVSWTEDIFQRFLVTISCAEEQPLAVIVPLDLSALLTDGRVAAETPFLVERLEWRYANSLYGRVHTNKGALLSDEFILELSGKIVAFEAQAICADTVTTNQEGSKSEHKSDGAAPRFETVVSE
jgi:hypothetical protein